MPSKRRYTLTILLALVAAALLAGCAGSQTGALASVLPDAISGWTATEDVRTFDNETLFDLVNGQADAFFAYGFEQVAVRRYENADGVALNIEVWQLATPADAYGLFTTSVAGEPVAIGNAGDADPGRRIAFWQDRAFVQVFAFQPIPEDELTAITQAVAAALPSGGERPALVDRLPAEGLAERSGRFFHEEISIQDQVWLGGQNLLGLSQETNGVLARYDLGGTTARLLLIEYPAAGAASAGLAALQGGEIEGLVASAANGNLLGAVFGAADVGAANALLEAALR